jgi:hypothetical protein
VPFATTHPFDFLHVEDARRPMCSETVGRRVHGLMRAHAHGR